MIKNYSSFAFLSRLSYNLQRRLLGTQNLVTTIYVDKDGLGGGDNFFDSQSDLGDDDKNLIQSLVVDSSIKVKPGTSQMFYGVSEKYRSISVAALPIQYDDSSDLKEFARKSFASCVKTFQSKTETEVLIDSTAEMTAASEGTHLAAFNFDAFKAQDKKKPSMNFSLMDEKLSNEWREGIIFADSQNFARSLMEMPSNYLTPQLFVDQVLNFFQPFMQETELKLDFRVRDENWLIQERMNGFLAIAKGSVNKPILLEMHLQSKTADDSTPPIILVGKGVTFDTGGISIKPSAKMGLMRGDMGGAACVAATMLGLMRLNVPLKFIGLMGLCENMPSGNSVKPGDVIMSRKGKSIEIDNTDAEGRVVLADVLNYADQILNGLPSPVQAKSAIIDLATLTGAIQVALGGGYSALFSRTNKITAAFNKAGAKTGDQVWRMPLSSYYDKQVCDTLLADVTNTSKLAGRGGGACTAAAFLSQFVDCPHWAHLDIAGVMENQSDVEYLGKGMSGRPTRTMIEFCRTY